MIFNDTMIQRFENMRMVGKDHLADGRITVDFFHPYTRATWEFRVNGVLRDRRYTAKSAASHFVELWNENPPGYTTPVA